VKLGCNLFALSVEGWDGSGMHERGAVSFPHTATRMEEGERVLDVSPRSDGMDGLTDHVICALKRTPPFVLRYRSMNGPMTICMSGFSARIHLERKSV